MKTREKYLDAKLESIRDAIDFIDINLKDIKTKKKDCIKAELLAEEFLAHTIKGKADGDSDKIRVAVSKTGPKKSVIVSFKGKQIKGLENIGLEKDLSFSDMSADTEAFFRKKIISSNNDSFTCGYKNGINKISISVKESATLPLKGVFITFLLAFVIGLIVRLILPKEANLFISENILHTIETIFLNAFKLITGPVIFFSIASSISSYSDLRELGKNTSKFIFLYVITTAFTLFIGLLISSFISPGDSGEFASMASGGVSETGDFSVRDTITNIIPSNFFKPFLEFNTIQIIIIAVLVGIAAGKLGEKSSKINDFLSKANELFFKITEIITKYLHVLIFVSVAALVISIKPEATGAILSLVLCIFLGLCLTFVFYNFLLLISTRTSPIQFFKKAYPIWINAFALHSSNAAISFTMESCKKELNISPKIYSFSIPLGAIINIDDLSMMFSLSILFFANVFGIGFKPSDYFILIIMIVVLSLGTPGIPSGGTISFTLLLSQFGIPMEALAIFISINAILDPFATGNNVYGNAVKSFIVSHSLKNK
ncbi:MAG: dicarboxylate/amino acid:cation symporter [Parasporobacterium sp.]|nr:dicarboxylate/amino acid:cation symporter [Parasporobacterium sp.]